MNKFGKSLDEMKRLFIILTITIIICSIPLYVLKDVNKEEYVTHYHQYQWYFTISYLSGSVPGILLMILCFISLLIFLTTLLYLSNKNNTNINSNNNLNDLENKDNKLGDSNEVINTKIHSSSSPSLSLSFSSSSSLSLSETTSEIESSLRYSSEIESKNNNSQNNSSNINILNIIDKLYLCLILIVNIGIVGTVNGLYIWSTLQDLSSLNRLLIQLSLSLFGMIWKVIIRSIFPNRIKNSLSEVWLISLIGVINGIIIPCISTSLTSPNCYQRLIVEPEDISSSYNYEICQFWNVFLLGRSCALYTTATVDVIKLTPPFTYSYQCGSTIITTYIPVYMYSTIFQIIIDILRVLVGFQLKYEDYPQFIEKTFQTTKIIEIIINNMILLLSFGLSSPLLCISICLSGVINISCWSIILGKLIFQSQDQNKSNNNKQNIELKIINKSNGIDFGEENKKKQYNKVSKNELVNKLYNEMKNNNNIIGNPINCMENCKWLIIVPCCLFITLLSWEIVGDKERWDGGYWILLIGVGIIIVIWIVDYMKLTQILLKNCNKILKLNS